MKTNYTQCKLISIANNQIFQIAWIPSEFAIKEKKIKIEEVPGLVIHWIVKDTYGIRNAEEIEKHERDYLKFHVD